MEPQLPCHTMGLMYVNVKATRENANFIFAFVWSMLKNTTLSFKCLKETMHALLIYVFIL